MNALDDILQTIDPWLDNYMAGGLAALSCAEAAAVGIWLLDVEVNNGGFHQYYFNTGGELATLTVRALQSSGATQTAALLDAANRNVPALPLPQGRDARATALDQVADPACFGALETEYYLEEEDRIGLLAAHLRRNAALGRRADGTVGSASVG